MKPVIDFNLVWEDENIVFIKWMAFQDTMIFIFFSMVKTLIDVEIFTLSFPFFRKGTG